jgi:AcrR family transcriptional regulator
VEDRRKQIIDAGLALLREEGLAGLTQPRVVARTGLRQSHLTYYYPTRAALLAAVAHAAIDAQRAGVLALIAHIRSSKDAAEVITVGTARYDNTRVLVALSQAAEQEPEVRKLFNELADGSIVEILSLFEKLGLKESTANADLLHALFIGLSVTHLATGRSDQQERSKAALEIAFEAFGLQGATKTKSSRAAKDAHRQRKEGC